MVWLSVLTVIPLRVAFKAGIDAGPLKCDGHVINQQGDAISGADVTLTCGGAIARTLTDSLGHYLIILDRAKFGPICTLQVDAQGTDTGYVQFAASHGNQTIEVVLRGR